MLLKILESPSLEIFQINIKFILDNDILFSQEFMDWLIKKGLKFVQTSLGTLQLRKNVLFDILQYCKLVRNNSMINEAMHIQEKIFSQRPLEFTELKIAKEFEHYYLKPSSSTLQCVISAAKRIENRATQKRYKVPLIEVSENEFLCFCLNTFGIVANEQLLSSLKRLKTTHQAPDFRNLSRHFESPFKTNGSKEKEKNSGWILPFSKNNCLAQVQEYHSYMMNFLTKMTEYNSKITESCEYLNNNEEKEFLDYLKNKEGYAQHMKWMTDKNAPDLRTIKLKFQKARLPQFSQTVLESFYNELVEKRGHYSTICKIKEGLKLLETIHMSEQKKIQFMVGCVVETVRNKKRENGFLYDLYFTSKKQAYHAFQLFYEIFQLDLQSDFLTRHNSQYLSEFNVKPIHQYKELFEMGLSNDFIKAFHGPEVHIFGKGPRWPHYNVAVLHNGSPINIHLYFGE